MVRIAFIVYRRWAFEIFKSLSAEPGQCRIPLLCTTENPEFSMDEVPEGTHIVTIQGTGSDQLTELFDQYRIDIACFFGWSRMVSQSVYERYTCVCLHPSALPKFRGGSPLQHQILAGIIDSQVTIFRIGNGIDAGDIHRQYPLSLEGELSDIFARMTEIGISATRALVTDHQNGELTFRPQLELSAYPPLKRRAPEDSELTKERLTRISRDELYNFVRALADPYPNAFMRFTDKCVVLRSVEMTTDMPDKGLVLNELASPPQTDERLFIRVRDGYIKITRYDIV